MDAGARHIRMIHTPRRPRAWTISLSSYSETFQQVHRVSNDVTSGFKLIAMMENALDHTHIADLALLINLRLEAFKNGRIDHGSGD